MEELSSGQKGRSCLPWQTIAWFHHCTTAPAQDKWTETEVILRGKVF